MEVTIPTTLKEINCYQLSKITEATKLIDNDTLLKMTIVAIVCNLTMDKVAKFSMSDINEISDSILNLLSTKPEIESFKINGIEFGFIPDLEAIKGNEYLDLEMYLESDIFKSMSVMYRPIKRKKNEIYTIEKYKGANKYEELMRQAPASAYIAAKVFFFEFSNRIAERYSSLFTKKSNEFGSSSFGEKWGWYITIDEIAGGDRLRYKEVVTKLNINEILTHLEYLKDKASEEQFKKENAKRAFTGA